MSGGHKSTSTSTTPLNALQIQTSVYGAAIPLCYGQNRVPFNLMQYEDFTAIPHTTTTKTGGKGGGGSVSNTTYTYTVAMACGLSESCAGGVYGIGKVWSNKEVHTLSDLGLTLFNGADGQTPWSYLVTHHPTRADAYPRTAYVAGPAFNLDSSGSIPNLTFELTGLLPFNAGTINDAEPSAIVADYLGEAQHGVSGFAPYVGDLTLFGKYCTARGLFLSPVENNQRNAGAFIQELAEICNSAPVWSNGKFTLIPYGDQAITGNGVTYTPNLTPVYDLTDDDWIRVGDQPPLVLTIKDPAQAYNWIRIQFNDRSIDYNPNIAQAKDQADIDANGLVGASVVNYPAITQTSVANDVATIKLQRALHNNNTWAGSLPIKYSLLEVMDLLAVYSNDLGMTNQLMRIIDIKEQNDQLDLMMEEVNVGVASAPLYGTQPSTGYNQDYNADPGAVEAPTMINAPGLLAPTGYETWIAVCGTNALWGGCVVWVSDDGTEYRRVGTMIAPCRYGALTAPLGIGTASPDVTNVIEADIFQGQILSGTDTDRDEWRTLLYVGGEFISYKTATLDSGTSYDLSSLQRGGYGSVNAVHNTGDDFIVIDEGIFRLPYDRGNISKTVYFKFTSFNIFGAGQEDLAAATAYTHVLGASDITAPVVPTDVADLTIASGIVNINCQRGTHFRLSLTANCAPVLQNAPSRYTWWIEIDQTASYTFTLPSNWVPGNGIPYATSSGAGAIDVLQCMTFDGGLTVRYVVFQAPMSVSLSPSPASATANSVSGANVSPSVVVTATVSGASGGSTHAWTRIDSGDPTHSISSASASNPTFSIPSGHVAQSNTNVWQDTVTDGLGRVATKQVTITLTVTTSGSPPLTAVSTPSSGYKYIAAPRGVNVWTGASDANVVPNGGTPGYTHSWAWHSGDARLSIYGSTTGTTFQVHKSTGGGSIGVFTAVFRDTVTDAASNSVTVDYSFTLETDDSSNQ